MKIEFYKFQGAGNDFVMLDNRNHLYDSLTAEMVKQLCDRHFGIGGDGLMLLNNKEGYDFEMIYYNSDGNLGSMCGNGGRCIVKFALMLGIRKREYVFLASDGVHHAEVMMDKEVKLQMQDVKDVEYGAGDFILNTGSPHYVQFVKNAASNDVVNEGRKIRNSKEFLKEGVNVNFVEVLSDDEIMVRTYERGVEDETLSCGTGVTASALMAAHNDIGFNRVEVKTTGGNLCVEFEKMSDKEFCNIWLLGPADFVFSGTINLNSKDV
jgi:diaminopimelate epimerase